MTTLLTGPPVPDRAVPDRLRALGFHDFRWLFAANVISVTGGFMQLAGVNWIVTDLTDSGAKVSLAAVASLVPFMVFSPIGGALCDRFERRLVMLVMNWIQLGMAVAMGAFYEAGWLTYWVLVAFALLSGAVNGMTAPVQQAIIPELVDVEALRSAALLNSTSFTVARAAGPALAGLTIELYGAGVTFWANAITFVAVIVAMMQASRRPPPDSSMSARFWSEFRSGVRYVRSSPGIRTAQLVGALLALVIGPLQTPFTALIARRAFDGDAGDYGLLQAAFGLGSLLAALTTLAVDPSASHRTLVRFGLLVMAGGTIALGLSPSLGWGLASLGFVGAGFMVVTSNTLSALQALCDDAFRGRVMAVWMMIFSAVTPIAVQVEGTLADIVAIEAVVAGTGVAALACTAVLWGSLHRLDSHRPEGSATTS